MIVRHLLVNFLIHDRNTIALSSLIYFYQAVNHSDKLSTALKVTVVDT